MYSLNPDDVIFCPNWATMVFELLIVVQSAISDKRAQTSSNSRVCYVVLVVVVTAALLLRYNKLILAQISIIKLLF